MIGRLCELQRQTRNADEWRWQLWLDEWLPEIPDICAWALKRLERDLALAENAGPAGIAEAAARAAITKPRPSDPSRAIFNRVPKPTDRHAILSWVGAIFAGQEQQASLHHAEPPIFDIGLKAMGIPRSELPPPKLGIDRMSVAWYREILATTEGREIEQARRDWQAIARLTEALETVDWNVAGVVLEPKIEALTKSRPEPPSKRARKARRRRPLPRPAIVDLFLDGLCDLKTRPYLLALFIGLRRSSPDNSKVCTQALALAESMLSEFPRGLESPPRPSGRTGSSPGSWPCC
jgi:hypothetical protein